MKKPLAPIEGAGAPKITCPFCRRSWRVTEATQKAIREELECWDRRFDRPETIVEAIVDLLSEALRQQMDSEKAVRRLGKKCP